MRKIYPYTSQQIADYSVKNFWGAKDRGSFPSSGEKENYTERSVNKLQGVVRTGSMLGRVRGV